MPGSIYIVINARVVLERGLEYANIPHIVHGTTPFMFGRSVNVLCKLIGIELEDDGGPYVPTGDCTVCADVSIQNAQCTGP